MQSTNIRLTQYNIFLCLYEDRYAEPGTDHPD